MTKRTITLVTHYFSTHRGGIEQVAGALAARLAATGDFNIEWFASDCDALPPLQEGLSLHPMRTWNGMEKRGMPWPVWSWHALRRLAVSIRNTDIVHVHDFIYFGNIAAFFLARWYNKPIVVTQHTGYTTYPNPRRTLTLKIINRTIGHIILSAAQQTIFISDEIRRQFARHINPRAATAFWPNAVDTSIFYPAADAPRGNDKPVLIFAGRFIEMKGLNLLRQLATAMPETHWWFAGWGELHPSGWNLPNVRVFENRSGESLTELYRAADMLVLPSLSEGFPLVVQEAMACGTLCLVSTQAAIGSQAAQPWLSTCELEPLNTACARWKEKLLSLLENKPRRDAISAFARSQWAWEDTTALYSELFKRLTRPSR